MNKIDKDMDNSCKWKLRVQVSPENESCERGLLGIVPQNLKTQVN